MYRIPEFYMIFARKMPEFHIIIAGKIFFPNIGGARVPPPSPTPMLMGKEAMKRSRVDGGKCITHVSVYQRIF